MNKDKNILNDNMDQELQNTVSNNLGMTIVAAIVGIFVVFGAVNYILYTDEIIDEPITKIITSIIVSVIVLSIAISFIDPKT